MNASGASGPENSAADELGKPRNAHVISLSNRAFYTCLFIIGGTYVLLILAMLAADAAYMADENTQPGCRF